MYNLRILKKKSKQAAFWLNKYWPDRVRGDMYPAERGNNYHGLKVRCRCKLPTRLRGMGCDCQWYAKKGTPMVGAMQGYYEPEWHEETVLTFLQKLVLWDDRPQGVTDSEWRHIMTITGVTAADMERVRRYYEGI